MKIFEISENKKEYLDLLLLADEQEDMIDRYPEVTLLIENRCGSVYHGGRFLVSKSQEVEELCNRIVQNHLRLKIAYDVPQIYTAHIM